VPPALYDQLADGGRLVVPRGSRRGQELVLVLRTPEGPVERRSIPCRFVPLVGDEGFGED
jgi:protein-L-isoaspartate(D-aspartate) O-methyltransferase